MCTPSVARNLSCDVYMRDIINIAHTAGVTYLSSRYCLSPNISQNSRLPRATGIRGRFQPGRVEEGSHLTGIASSNVRQTIKSLNKPHSALNIFEWTLIHKLIANFAARASVKFNQFRQSQFTVTFDEIVYIYLHKINTF